MGRDASKAVGNVYFEARILASKRDESLKSREGAAEKIGISVDSLVKYELGKCKVVPADNIVRMAKVYHAPELMNQYCCNECPIGQKIALKIDKSSLEIIALKLIFNLESIDEMKRLLMAITVDGLITNEEQPQLDIILGYFAQIEKSIGELKLWCMKNTEGLLNKAV